MDGKDRGAEARGDVDEAQKREIFNPIGAYIYIYSHGGGGSPNPHKLMPMYLRGPGALYV